jgi:hypothetical protein
LISLDLRDEALRRAGHRCEWRDEDDRMKGAGGRCRQTLGLQLHHVHYGTVGRETLQDVRVLCDYHHRVQTALDRECAICCRPLFYHAQDAEAWLRHFANLYPDRRVADLLHDHAKVCDSCEDAWTRDD